MPRARGWRALLLCGGTLVGIQAVFVTGVVLAQLVPNHRIATTMRVQSVKDRWGANADLTSAYGDRLDTGSECPALLDGVVTKHRNVVEEALASGTEPNCHKAREFLSAYGHPGAFSPPGTDNFRYWHGYAVLTRPLLGAFGLAVSRFVIAVLLAAGTALLWWRVARRWSAAAAALLLGPLLVTSDFVDAPLQVPHGISLGVAVTAGAVALEVARRWPSRTAVALTCIVAGGAYCYVDVLTNPPLAWALTVTMVMAGVQVSVARRTTRDLAALAGVGAVSWAVGYFGSWVAKWLLAGTFLGMRHVFDVVRSQFLFRVHGNTPLVSHYPGAGLVKTMHYWVFHAPLSGAVALVVVAAACAVMLWRAARRGSWDPAGWLFMLPAGLVAIWLLVLSNHSQQHARLVYRAWPMALGVVAFGVYAATRSTRSVEPRPAGDQPLAAADQGPSL
jgi:hypothetical protein